MYDGNLQRINAQRMNEKQGEGQSVNAAGKKESIKAGKGEDDGEEPKQVQRKSRKKSQGIS